MDTQTKTQSNRQDYELIHTNLSVLAAYAWFNYRQRGKGAVVIDTNHVVADTPTSNDWVLTVPLGYVTPTMAQLKQASLPIDMLELVQAYTPETEIVVSVLRVIEDRDYMGHYRLAINPAPPDIYKAIGAQMLATNN